jgi:hypothetical protein
VLPDTRQVRSAFLWEGLCGCRQENLPKGNFAKYSDSGGSICGALYSTFAGCLTLNGSSMLSPVLNWRTPPRRQFTLGQSCHQDGALVDMHTMCNLYRMTKSMNEVARLFAVQADHVANFA